MVPGRARHRLVCPAATTPPPLRLHPLLPLRLQNLLSIQHAAHEWINSVCACTCARACLHASKKKKKRYYREFRHHDIVSPSCEFVCVFVFTLSVWNVNESIKDAIKAHTAKHSKMCACVCVCVFLVTCWQALEVIQILSAEKHLCLKRYSCLCKISAICLWNSKPIFVMVFFAHLFFWENIQYYPIIFNDTCLFYAMFNYK